MLHLSPLVQFLACPFAMDKGVVSFISSASMLINLHMSLATAETAAKSQQICEHCGQLKGTRGMVRHKKACKRKLDNAKQDTEFVKRMKEERAKKHRTCEWKADLFEGVVSRSHIRISSQFPW